MTAKALEVDLPAEIFDVQVNIPLIHQVVVAQQAAARQGTHDTKTRGEVRGGGKKPYKQKGTGRARQGSIRAPQFAGGGTVHGPTPRGYEQRTPKKMKAAALRGALSDRARAGRVHVVESFVTGDQPSTKAALDGLRGLTGRPRTLVVLERGDNLTWLSLRNVDTVHLLAVDQLNTYDVLLCDDVVFTKAAYDTFVGARGGEVRAEAPSEAAQQAEPDNESQTDTSEEAAE
jgi:large subunit ribosomal protein L4